MKTQELKTPVLKKKKVHPDNHKTKRPQRRGYRYVGEYKDFFTKRIIPVSEEFIVKLSEDLVDWATKDEKALTARKFWSIKGISHTAAKGWMKDFPILKEAYETAKHEIGIRREEGALVKKFDNSTFFKTARNYSPDFVVTAEWESHLRAKENRDIGKNLVVEMKKTPETDIVPKKESSIEMEKPVFETRDTDKT